MKTLYCKNCGKMIAKVENGSKLHKNLVTLCGDCYKEMNDLLIIYKSECNSINNNDKYDNDWGEVFGDFFTRR